jgi:hypothetical protein
MKHRGHYLSMKPIITFFNLHHVYKLDKSPTTLADQLTKMAKESHNGTSWPKEASLVFNRKYKAANRPIYANFGIMRAKCTRTGPCLCGVGPDACSSFSQALTGDRDFYRNQIRAYLAANRHRPALVMAKRAIVWPLAAFCVYTWSLMAYMTISDIMDEY